MKILKFLLALACFGVLCRAQNVTVTGTILDASGRPVSGASMKATLWNCGANQAQVASIISRINGSVTSGNFIVGETVIQTGTQSAGNVVIAPIGSNSLEITVPTGTADAVQTWLGQTSGAVYTPISAPTSLNASSMVGTTVSFPANSQGVVSGTIAANDVISCGGVFDSTRWYVTLMSNSVTPLNTAQRYHIKLADGTFNFNNAQVDTSTPPNPAWSMIFADPVKSQTWTQLPGTTGFFVGNFDFSGATVLGIGGGGGGGGTGTITGITAGPGLVGGGTSGFVTLGIPAAGVTNTMLQNNSVTVNTGTGLSGGGTVALGGTLNLTNTVTGTIPQGITFVSTLQSPSSANWQQSLSSSLTAGSPSVVTLGPCPAGIDTTSGAGYQVLISDANPEVVNVSTQSGDCTSGASSGTIHFTPFFSHSSYTIGSASSGIQETLNTACGVDPIVSRNIECNVTIPANGPYVGTVANHLYNDYNVYGTIFFHANQGILSGYGVSLNCGGPYLGSVMTLRGPCLQVGNLTNANNNQSNSVQGISFRAPISMSANPSYAGVAITQTSVTSGVGQITTATDHGFRVGDRVTVLFTDDKSYWGDTVVTAVPSSTTFQFAKAGTISAQTTPGVVALSYVAILDNGSNTNFTNIQSDLGGQSGKFNNFFDIWDDENTTISKFGNGAISLNTNANWAGSFIFSAGNQTQQTAPVITLRDSTITANGGNGVTVLNSNGVYIENSVIQSTGLWQLRVSNEKGNFQGVYAKNLYGENAAFNPLSPAKTPFPGTGSVGALVGALALNGSAKFDGSGSTNLGGYFPNTGSGYNYWVVANVTAAGTGTVTHTAPLLCQNGSTTATNVLTCPRIANGQDTITYDYLRTGGTLVPSYGNCPGGSGAACGSLPGGTGVAQCSGLTCSFTDSGPTASTSAYTLLSVGSYIGNLNYWPGTIVTVNKPVHVNVDQSLAQGVGTAGGPVEIAEACPNGANMLSGYVTCPTGGAPSNSSTSQPARVIVNGPSNSSSPWPSTTGDEIFSSMPNATRGPTDLITVDSTPGPTWAAPDNRRIQNANDSAIGLDNPLGTALTATALSFRSPVSISNYIGAVPNPTTPNWLERLTATTKTLKVPLDMLGAAGPPAVPAANYCRQYYDSTAGQVGWINSVGGSCGPSASAFASLSGGISTQNFLMGTGGSLSYTGTGTVNANSLLGSPIPAVTTGNLCWTGGALSWCPAGTGTVTSVGIVGTANQITVTGTSPITGAGTLTLSLPTALNITALTASGTITGNVTGNLTGTASNAVGLMGSSIPTLAVGDLCWTGTALSWCAASGSGTVTTFSAGNLSPLFTTSVTNPTSAPALAFSLSNAPAFSLLGNNTGSSAAPGYNYTVGSTGNSIPQLNSGLLLASIIPVATNVAIGGVKPDGTSILNAAGVLSATSASIGADVSGAAATAQTAAQTFATAAVATETSRATTAEGLLVPKTTTVNGHALSANVTVSASDLTTGTLPHAQLPTLISGDIPNNAANTSGLAATASALGSTPTLCGTGQSAGGILANGNATNCIASTITYPFQAPVGDSTHPQYTFVVDTLTGIYNAPEGDQQAVTQVVVSSGTATATILSPVNSLSWAAFQTFTFTSLPSPITSMNAVQYVISSVSGSRPTSTVTFNCPLQCGVAGQAPVGTYASTAGAYGKVYGGGFAGHQWIFDRLQSSTNNTAQTGSVQFARRDAVKTRSGPIDVTGHDLSLIRGSNQFSPTNSPSTMLMTVNGAVTGGATSISIARAAGANWSAVAGDPLVIQLIPADKPAGIAGDADLQFYTITSNVTVTGGTNTTVSISPAVPALGLAGGEVISPYYIRAQLGDATGAQVLGDLHVFGTIYSGEALSSPWQLSGIKQTGAITVPTGSDFSLFIDHTTNQLSCTLSAALGGTSCVPTGGGMVYPGAGIPVSVSGTSWGTSLTQYGSAAGLATTSDPGATAEVPMVANGTHGMKPSASGALASGAFAAAYSLPTASTSTLGGVKVDGSTITIASGVISAAASGGDTVTSPNSTLSVGGTSSNTTLDLNLAHTNTWSVVENFTAGVTTGSSPPACSTTGAGGFCFTQGLANTVTNPAGASGLYAVSGGWEVFDGATDKGLLITSTTAAFQSLTTTGSGAATLSSGVLNIPTPPTVPAVGSRPQQVQWGWQAGSSVGSSTVLYGPFPFSIPTSIPTNDSDSTGQGYFALNTAPAATWVVTVYKIPAGGAACSGTPASIGTISVSTSNIATFSLTATSFAKGDCWEFVAPSGVDTNAPIPSSVSVYVLD